MTTLYGVDRDELAATLAGEPRYRLDQLWNGLYGQLALPTELTTLPKPLRQRITDGLPTALVEVVRQVNAKGDTVKYLWELTDGSRIETVLMVYPDRVTVCVSSQAGCAMACGFCATGQAGFTRHLTVGEIVEQVVRAGRDAKAMGRRLANVVFMGMGEPLANEAAVWGAIERIHGAIGLSARAITVSTVGLVPGIRHLADRNLPVNLAVSLHAANDALRDDLVPINRRYPLDALMHACAEYLAKKGRRLSFEWALIKGVNDRDSDAEELARLCRRLRLPAHVNLIPLNPTPGYPTVGSSPTRVHEFRDLLERLRVNATVRRNRGTDIDAACGQLAAGRPVTLKKGVAHPRSRGGACRAMHGRAAGSARGRRPHGPPAGEHVADRTTDGARGGEEPPHTASAPPGARPATSSRRHHGPNRRHGGRKAPTHGARRPTRGAPPDRGPHGRCGWEGDPADADPATTPREHGATRRGTAAATTW